MRCLSGPRFALFCALAVTCAAAVQPGAAAASHHRRHHRRHAALLPRVLGAECAYAKSSVSSQPLATMRATLLCLTNLERTSRGLAGLRASTRLNGVAQAWTQTMVATGDFTHGSNFALRISASGYDWQAAGENIATGYMTPLGVVEAWMASTDHCRNILDPSYRDFGTGASPAAVGNSTGPGTWSEDFGLLMSQSAPSHNTGPQNGCPYASAG